MTLDELYSIAVEDTKKKVKDDIIRFLGSQDQITTLQQVIEARKQYIEQIWLNIWLNKTNQHISKKDKKEFLQEKGYEVEGVDKKVINHLFRTEIRDAYTFNVLQWIYNEFQLTDEQWENLYNEAKRAEEKKKEEERREKERTSFFNKLEQHIDDLLTDEYPHYFLHVRFFVAKKLKEIFALKPRYEQIDSFALHIPLHIIGSFEQEDYRLLGDFFPELTGEIMPIRYRGKKKYIYENYGAKFEKDIFSFIQDIIPKLIFYQLKDNYESAYTELFEIEFSPVHVQGLLKYDLREMREDFIDILKGEYVVDLLHLADLPFDHDTHKKQLEIDFARREERKEQERLDREREKQLENERINYIFGAEYEPRLGRNIRYILHIGDTNTGKTHHALEQMMKSPSGLYLAPLRLLALEVYDKLNDNGIPCTLKTGEEERITEYAHHYSCTVEMFHEKEFYDCIVIDEAQMLADKDRGFSWYKAITKANANEVHIIGSRSVKGLLKSLLAHENVEIKEYTREIPLKVEKKPFKLSQTKKGDALVCFSRKRVLDTASRLQNNGYSVSMIYGSMPPETRRKEMERFIKGKSQVIVATDAIGMGLNLPIRRVVFLETEKFDGEKRRSLTSQEVKQIAGRAGRKGIYDVGKVNFVDNIKYMKNLLMKVDEPVQTFAIAPTNNVFERFQKYYRDLGKFFYLWDKFVSPYGTEKASLSQERELYEIIRGTEIEMKLSMMDLYGFLHLPFSTKDPGLTYQWVETMYAIVRGEDLPEPNIKKRNLASQELSYKAISLHLLFLYRLDRRLEAAYWEKVREELSEAVHKSLRTEVKKMVKKCRNCGRPLPWEHKFAICDKCYWEQKQMDHW